MSLELISNSSLSSSSSSHEMVVSEDFDWTDEETKNEYMNFPLRKWYDIVIKYIYISINYVVRHENIYKNSVNKILKYDVFKGEEFKEDSKIALIITEDDEVRDFIKYEFSEIVKANLGEKVNKWIQPNFIVWNINKKRLFEILEERKYMMYFNGVNIPDNIDTVNIIGELINKKNQHDKYELFIKNFKKKYFILMKFCNVSYKTFLEDKNNCSSNSEIPQIICYVPRIYLKNCYDKFNEIIKMKYYQPIEWGISQEFIEKKINTIKQTLNEKKENLTKNFNKKTNDLNEDINLLRVMKTIIIKEKNNLLKAQYELLKKEVDLRKEKEKNEKEEEDLKKEKENLEKEIEELDKKLEKLEKQEKEKLNKEILNNEINCLEYELKELNKILKKNEEKNS